MLSYTAPAVTPTEAQAYITAAGSDGWPAASTAQAQAIMRGQRYLAARFNGRWLTEWENDGAPDQVRFAIIEAALVEARAPGGLSPVSTPATDKVLVGAGKLTWERIGDASAPDAHVPRLVAVDGLLAGLVRHFSSGFMLRAIGG